MGDKKQMPYDYGFVQLYPKRRTQASGMPKYTGKGKICSMRSALIRLTLLLVFTLTSCQSLGWETDLSTPVFPLPFQTHEIPQPQQISQTPTPLILQEAMTETTTPSPEATFPTLTPSITWTPQPSPTNRPQLAEDIDDIISQAGGRWHIIIKEIDGPTLYSQLPEQRINIASVVKVPIALLFFKALEERGVREDQLVEYLQTTGVGGRTFDQLLRAMLVKSEGKAADILLEYIPNHINIPAQMAAWDMQFLDLNSRRYTATGIASIFERLYQGEYVSETARELILSYLSEYTPNDDTRIGILSERLPENYSIYNKRGSLLTPYVVADSAILENEDGSDYVLIIFASQGEPKTTYEVLDQSVGEIALAFWRHLSITDP
jgi:beta-lactamase class A